MLFQSSTVQLHALSDGCVELRFDRQEEAINKLDEKTMNDLDDAVAHLAAQPDLRGVLVTSAKDVFIVGADITEFTAMFRKSAMAITDQVLGRNRAFIAFEDLPVPSVMAINGFALGGGLEFALCASHRVMAASAQVGVPEVKLGLFPGLGGTVRLPRVADLGAALDWVTTGAPASAQTALAAGVVDAVVEPASLREQALALLQRAVAGELDWRAAQERKRQRMTLDAVAAGDIFDQAHRKTAPMSARHQPAARAAVELMQAAVSLPREAALRLEAENFGVLAKSQAAASLVQAFLNEQSLKKQFKGWLKQARPIKQGAVLGAGIMGGGIAYTSALRGTPVLLKDIQQGQLDIGMHEARKLIAKQVKTGRKSQAQADAILASIQPALSYEGYTQADIVIEAIVENIKVKHAVLSELETVVRPDTVIASNTSSLRIDDLAAPLVRPENFVGMHFFNPVPVMPLVEVIRGSKTSDTAVATAIGYCVAMGKTPIVVRDCPGFLVNRILTAYQWGFLNLLRDGADFVQVDRVMEAFGWPMGPAYLADVVGMDTGSHVSDVISAGYPDRMPGRGPNAQRLLAEHGRLGQKSGLGFYRYDADPTGKPRRSPADDTHALLAALQPHGRKVFGDDEIVDRMMVALVLEAARALEEGVVGTPAELDMAMLMGVGFPAYLGGPFKYADWLGLAVLVEKADRLASLGPLYQVTPGLREMASRGANYY